MKPRCGVATYGPLGLVAPLGLLAAVHLVSRMWSAPTAVEGPAVGTVPTAVGASGAGSNEQAGSVAASAAEDPDAAVPAPVRLEQQHDRRRPRVAATTSAGRAAPTEDRAA